MKTKIITHFALLLVACVLVTLDATAQPPKYARPYNPSPGQMMANPALASYSFRLYKAPDNGYGYDILKNGKPLFRQFVLAFTREDGKKVLVDKRHAENAAAVAIEKVKKGMAPALNEAEIRRIAGH